MPNATSTSTQYVVEPQETDGCMWLATGVRDGVILFRDRGEPFSEMQNFLYGSGANPDVIGVMNKWLVFAYQNRQYSAEELGAAVLLVCRDLRAKAATNAKR